MVYDSKLDPQLALLKRLFDQGKLDAAAYRQELQTLGVNPAEVLEPPSAPKLSDLRERLKRLGDTQLDTLIIDGFPDLADELSRGLRKSEKINLLLDLVRRQLERIPVLERALDHIPDACDPKDAPACYLNYVIEANQRLPLPRSAGVLHPNREAAPELGGKFA
jgi:hypothetical protein